MARHARDKSISGIYHIILRGINKQNLFEDDKDCQQFIETMHYYKTISKYELYAYCLMSNHIHLLIKENNEPISTIIKRISSSYVYWYNKKYERCGHLFQERFKSEAVETDTYFLTVLRYIHQNPIKAGIVKDVGEYLWSSFGEYIDNPVITDIDFVLSNFSTDRMKAKHLLRNYLGEENDGQCLKYKEKIGITDKEVMDHFKRLGIISASELQRLEKEHRNDVIMQIKEIDGISIRQLARITGISKSTISRI